MRSEVNFATCANLRETRAPFLLVWAMGYDDLQKRGLGGYSTQNLNKPVYIYRQIQTEINMSTEIVRLCLYKHPNY